jgi:hypothetical protein
MIPARIAVATALTHTTISESSASPREDGSEPAPHLVGQEACQDQRQVDGVLAQERVHCVGGTTTIT